jgi:hypothetical protein
VIGNDATVGVLAAVSEVDKDGFGPLSAATRRSQLEDGAATFVAGGGATENRGAIKVAVLVEGANGVRTSGG